jgi:hypothetical protein
MTVHDFEERLAWSGRAGEEPFWEAVYRKAFPNLAGLTKCARGTEAQRMGIDRLLLLGNGQTLKIDEKKRGREYSDILLERISSTKTGAPGWMEKDLAIDYLAYAFLPSKRCHLFPWYMLRRAWLHYREKWIAEHKEIRAVNEGYETISVAVPTLTLRAAVAKAALIDVSGEIP